MRLTTVILIASLIQVSAAGFAQKISLNVSNVSLKSAFKAIRSQSGYNFVCTEDVFKNSKPVSLRVKDLDFEQVIEQIFKGQPLTYEIENRTVVVKLKEQPSVLNHIIARFQAIDVRGKVVDEKGVGLAGATISVKGKSQSVKSGANGGFYLPNVDEKATLIISFVGFKMTEVAAEENLGILTLRLEDNSLEQVQIIAYGEVKQKFNTSNATSISGEKITNQPVTNPLIALQGRVPGLFIRQQNGLNTGSLSVNVQGKNSLRFQGNAPFYVIDGVPIRANLLTEGGSVTGTIADNATGISTLNFLNPNEIESITVLKDADATAIYGSRAANGAFLITTKKRYSWKN